MTVLPFLKWVGGKRGILDKLIPLLPDSWKGTYWEPFLGGGAMFFRLKAAPVVLSDTNEELIRTYRAVRENPGLVYGTLIAWMDRFGWSASGMGIIADMTPGKRVDIEVAARMIYLNRTAFNGLYRVNQQGRFNAPWGKYPKPVASQLIDLNGRLMAASSVLESADIRTGDFEAVLQGAKKGDFVYLDPPYVPLSKTASFTGYAAGGFGPADQGRLSLLCDRLTRRGVLWMLSNSYNEVTVTLFDPKVHAGTLHHTIITAPRAVAAKSSSRKAVKELVVRNYA